MYYNKKQNEKLTHSKNTKVNPQIIIHLQC